jgi:uncharacterized RDD family membrane protein YckC
MNCVNHPAVVEDVYACSRCGRPFCSNCLVTLQGRRYCATCKGEQLADIRSGVDATSIALAGIGRRFAAIWVDGLIIGLPLLLAMYLWVFPRVMGNSSEPPGMFHWVNYISLPFYILYEGLMLSARGQTLGKMALRIKVVQPNGAPISGGQAWGRSVARAVFVSFLSLINYLPAFFTKEKTCVHDMAAKTRVVIVR